MFKKKKIIVAMSGGVDSSLAAKILVDEGHEVMGIFLSFWKDPKAMNVENKCCSARSLMDARAVCTQLGIRLYVLDFSDVFKKDVVDNFLSEYEVGNTPNPCVRCNKFVKLGLLIEKSLALGYDYVATGHYARIKKQKFFLGSRKTSKYQLLRGVDSKKDQSYYLYKFSQKELSHLIFPLGKYTKGQVRGMAKEANLLVATKTESQEICFVPNDHRDFLRNYLNLKSGSIKTLDEKEVGRHQGLPLYTIGQRKGVEIGGLGPFYVVKKDLVNNVLYVTNDPLNKALFENKLKVKDVSWVEGGIKLPLVCQAMIRYGASPVECIIKKNNSLANEYFVSFNEVVRAITLGQSIVFYDKDVVLGGGVIVC